MIHTYRLCIHTPLIRHDKQRKSALVNTVKETHEIPIDLRCHRSPLRTTKVSSKMSNVFLAQCKQLFFSRWNRCHYPANASAKFWSNVFETYFPDFFVFCRCFGAFFGFANGQDLFGFFHDIFKLTSTICKWKTLRTVSRLPNTQTQMVDNTYSPISQLFSSRGNPLTAINWQ